MNIFQDDIDGVKLSLDVYLDTKKNGFTVSQITTFKDRIRKKNIFVSEENIGQFFQRMSDSGLEDIEDAMKSVIAKKFTVINALVDHFGCTDNAKFLYILQETDDEYKEVKNILKSGNDDNDNTVVIVPLSNGEECNLVISRNKPKSTRDIIYNRVYILEEMSVASLLCGRAICAPLKNEEDLNEFLDTLHSFRGSNEKVDEISAILDDLKNSISFENDFVPDLSQYDLI